MILVSRQDRGRRPMELFAKLFGSLLVLVYHCFDRIVIHGYLSGLSRPEQVVHFFRQVLGIPVLSKDVLSQRTNDYQSWVEAFARNPPSKKLERMHSAADAKTAATNNRLTQPRMQP